MVLRVGWMTGSQFLILREAYISILSLVLSLEPFEKFVVVGGGWSKVILVLSLRLKLNKKVFLEKN